MSAESRGLYLLTNAFNAVSLRGFNIKSSFDAHLGVGNVVDCC